MAFLFDPFDLRSLPSNSHSLHGLWRTLSSIQHWMKLDRGLVIGDQLSLQPGVGQRPILTVSALLTWDLLPPPGP